MGSVLLQILQRNNDYVIADLPRRIDVLGAGILEQSDQVLILVQPTLTHINDAARMIKLITKELAVQEHESPKNGTDDDQQHDPANDCSKKRIVKRRPLK